MQSFVVIHFIGLNIKLNSNKKMSNNRERFAQALNFSDYISEQYDELNTCTCAGCRLTDRNIQNTLRIHGEIIQGLRRAYINLVNNNNTTTAN
jgi:hypothetical protein